MAPIVTSKVSAPRVARITRAKRWSTAINAGNTWKTDADGYKATIETMSYCPHSACLATPYIKTNPDSTKKDNLENLDRADL